MSGEAQQRADAVAVLRGENVNDWQEDAKRQAEAVLALVERVEAAAQENKELLGGLYLTKHNLEKAEAWQEVRLIAAQLQLKPDRPDYPPLIREIHS